MEGSKDKPDFCVIGIGTSAGGLDALRTFFSRMPAEPGFACVVVVHLSPEHESHLVELLQPHTRMPVCQVVKSTPLEPNHVYVIPPNANLNSIDTHLRLSELEARRVNRAPIDHFLRTLAETHGGTAVGVVLSGAGSDGALGIRQIKEHGGLTMVQDPKEAEYASMPRSAIATGTVDLVLPLREMADEIVAYCATQPRVPTPGEDDALPDPEAALLEQILGEVRLRTGQEFAAYRRSMILHRVQRRMRLRHVRTLAEYLAIVRAHFEEPRALCNDLLLNVTEFFRDSASYETLQSALGETLESLDGGNRRVRIWSIGCSTGEEAYSLAMLLAEQAASRSPEAILQIFASELSPNALQHAREGVYTQEIATAISPDRLERFFVLENGHYRVRNELRSIVTFATHDLFKDPPYSHLNMIVCRNLLCDLQPAMRIGVLNLLYYALEPQGVLLVGPHDQVDSPSLFTRDSANPRLLRRVSGPRRPLELPPDIKPFALLAGERGGTPIVPARFDIATIFRAAIEHHAPPSVLIDSSNEVVHFSPTASRYVRIPGGELTRDVVELVPHQIAVRLESGLNAMREGAHSWQSDSFFIAVADNPRRMRVRLERAESGGRAPELLLVIFDDGVEQRSPVRSDGVLLDEVPRLQAELAHAHESLAGLSRLARQADSDQAVKARTEQLESVGEQLQNAQEELQAINEELISLSEESRYRQETFAQLAADFHHLLESTGLATLVVDRSLCIMRFSPRAAELFQITAADAGRPITDLKHRLRSPDLITEIQRVVKRQIEVELEMPTDDGRWFLARVQPSRGALPGFEGAAIVLVDITARRQAEVALQEADRRKDEFLAVLSHELRNPLAPISSGIDVLRQIPNPPPVVQKVTDTMARQTQQLVRLVDDLLEVSRISGGKLRLQMEPVQIADVLRDAAANVRAFIESQQHQLTSMIPEQPLVVEGDPTRLTQVVANLLHNAARYTRPHGQLALAASEAAGQAVITIRDNGVGISSNSLPHVFDMFYQADASGSSAAGLGIGLNLAKKLVEMHGGTISAESAGVGTGSTFTVRLPLRKGSEQRGARTPDAESTSSAYASKHRILIVDDNADAAETLRLLILMRWGGEVQTALSGSDALNAGSQLRPSIVLLDLSMPGMDGYELARRIRNEPWGTDALLVAVSGWGQDHDRHRSSEAGFDSHMTKPADPEALRAILSSADARSAHRAHDASQGGSMSRSVIG